MTAIGGSYLSVPTARHPLTTLPLLTDFERAEYIAVTSGLIPPTSLYLTVANIEPEDPDKVKFSQVNRQKHHIGTAKPVVTRIQPVPTSDKQLPSCAYEEKFNSVAKASEAYPSFGRQDRFHQAIGALPSRKGHLYARKSADIWTQDSE
jgi:hypothetical protein